MRGLCLEVLRFVQKNGKRQLEHLENAHHSTLTYVLYLLGEKKI
jgi:hypothetical protein